MVLTSVRWFKSRMHARAAHTTHTRTRRHVFKTLRNFSAAAAAGWSVPVVPTSAEKKEGIEDLLATIDAHHDHLIEHGGMDERLRRKLEMRILKTAEDMVRERFKAHRGGRLAALLDQVAARDMDPYAAAADLLADFNED